MNEFLSSNATKWRLARTIVQGIIGVVIAYIDVLIGSVPFIDPVMRPVIVALVMAVLSPVMSVLSGKDPAE